MKDREYCVNIYKVIFQTNLNSIIKANLPKNQMKLLKIKKKEGRYIEKLLNSKTDYVFKRIFGYRGNEEITANLLSSILEKPINNLQLNCNPILEKDLLDDKVGILDIRAKIDNIINCNIEMQIVDRKNIENRILFYWSKMFNSSIKSSQNYDKLEKTIVILITDYELTNFKEIKKYITKWQIREDDYKEILLTDKLNICIIELPKFKKYAKKSQNVELNSWIKFMNNPKEMENMENPNKQIEKAKEVLKEISQDEREIYLAELREKYIMDQKAIEDAGYDKGVIAGSEAKTIEVIRKMKEKNIDIEIIKE